MIFHSPSSSASLVPHTPSQSLFRRIGALVVYHHRLISEYCVWLQWLALAVQLVSLCFVRRWTVAAAAFFVNCAALFTCMRARQQFYDQLSQK